MKEIIKKHLSDSNSFLYKATNAIIVGIILFSFASIVQLFSRETDDYFHYNSITPTTEAFNISSGITFISNLERYQETNMRYSDTLFCGFGEDNLFWYSQYLGEYANAPKGHFISQWKYNGEIPSTAMICKLISSPYVSLPFGISTTPQIIETKKFWVK